MSRLPRCPLAEYFPASPASPYRPNRLRERSGQIIRYFNTAYRAIRSSTDLETALQKLGGKAILKTNELGYDGKGQMRVSAEDRDPEALWTALKTPEAILEGFVDFTAEISFLVCGY